MALRIVRALALLLVGVYAGGVLFTGVLSPSLFDIDGPAFAQVWQAWNDDYSREMPVLVLGMVALLIASTVLSRRRGAPVFGTALLALVLVLGTMMVTFSQLEPLNAIADGWDPARMPADWKDTVDTWVSWHLVRTVLAVGAFAVLLVSQVLDREPAPTLVPATKVAV